MYNVKSKVSLNYFELPPAFGLELEQMLSLLNLGLIIVNKKIIEKGKVKGKRQKMAYSSRTHRATHARTHPAHTHTHTHTHAHAHTFSRRAAHGP